MEVLAAMVLLALVLPAVMKGISIATALASNCTRRIAASELAENRLAEAMLLKEWQNGSMKGNFGNEYPDYRWELDTADRNEPGLKQVQLSVKWQQRGYEREVCLTTLVYDAQLQ